MSHVRAMASIIRNESTSEDLLWWYSEAAAKGAAGEFSKRQMVAAGTNCSVRGRPSAVATRASGLGVLAQTYSAIDIALFFR